MRATATAGEIKRFSLRSGDVLITKDSEVWNDIGVPALVVIENIARIKQETELINEFRRRLIADMVTGKYDPRVMKRN